jgi:hypothetical protein
MISAFGRHGMIRSCVASPAIFDLAAAAEPAVAVRPIIDIQGRRTSGAAP